MARTDEQMTLPGDVRSGAVAAAPQSDASAQFDRDAEAIQRDIYKRYGLFIRPGTPPEEAANIIARLAAKLGAGESAWANPEERAAARAEYARAGKTPDEVNQRWEESAYLLDPRTYEYMQKYGRDIDFLTGMAGKDTYRPDLLRRYESSKGERLYRRGMFNGEITDAPNAHGYERWSGIANGAMNAVSNPDTASGAYMTFSETVPNFLRMQGSGEADTAGESWEAARATALANNRYRIGSPAPILDLPAGASPAEIGRRIAELQREANLSRVPFADERWKRTAGWAPPGWLADTGDFLISMIDPTAAIPAARLAGGLGAVAAKGAQIAGKGWVAPLAKTLAKTAGKDALQESATEQVIGHPLQGLLGGMPRSASQYAVGGGMGGEYYPTKPVDPKSPPDYQYKSDAEVEEAKRMRRETHARLKDDRSIENADREAYSRLRADGTLPSPPKFYWGMSPSGPAY